MQGEEELMHIFNVDDQIDFYRIARLREIDGEAVEYEVSYFDRRIVPFISREIAEHSIYHYLENELKLKISHSQRKIVFRYANEEEKKAIDLGEYDMVVNVSSTYLADGRPFQYGSISYRPDKIAFTSTANDMSSFVNDRLLFKIHKKSAVILQRTFYLSYFNQNCPLKIFPNVISTKTAHHQVSKDKCIVCQSAQYVMMNKRNSSIFTKKLIRMKSPEPNIQSFFTNPREQTN